MTIWFHPVTFLIATMSIQWVTIATIGPFSVKIAYLALCGIILSAVVCGRVGSACSALVKHNVVWIVTYAIYLSILALALYGSPGQGIAPRQYLYLFGGIACAGFLAAEPRAGAMLRLGGGLGITLFLSVVEVKARQVGLSWTISVSHFLATGDLNYVVYSFLRAVFNSLNPDGEITVKAAEKNGIAVCILVASLLFRAGYRGRSFDWLGTGMTGLALLVVVLLNTRSVLIVAAASVLLAAIIRSMIKQDEMQAIWVVKITGLIAIMSLGVIAVTSDHPVLGLMSDRFAFEDASTEHRLAQYEWALQQIESNLLFGSGYADAFGHVIHNLFLSAWVHAGLMAFLLVLVFYLSVAAGWLWFCWKIIQHPGRWVLSMPFEWVAVLPILPLFRVWLSGDAGHLFLGEWIALAAFVGLVLRNQMQAARRATKPGPAVRIHGYLHAYPATFNGRRVTISPEHS